MTTDADNFWDRVGSAEGLARAPSLFMDWLMYSLDYIPNKFYFAVLANEPGAADKLSTLYKELGGWKTRFSSICRQAAHGVFRRRCWTPFQ